MRIVVDADDFFEASNALDKLFRIRAKVPEFKITLFTVLGLCSPEFLKLMSNLDWVELAFHTKHHKAVPEMEIEEFKDEIKEWKSLCFLYKNMVKGFKAPGWQMTTEAYEVLRSHGFWVCDHWPPHKSNMGRPEMMSFQASASRGSGGQYIHFHIHDVCGNGVGELFTPGSINLGGSHSVPCLKFREEKELDVDMRFPMLFTSGAKFNFMGEETKVTPPATVLMKGH